MKTYWEKGNWSVNWSFIQQTYYVYNNGKLFTKKYRFRDVRQYIE